jgi:hypothetical protein
LNYALLHCRGRTGEADAYVLASRFACCTGAIVITNVMFVMVAVGWLPLINNNSVLPASLLSVRKVKILETV